ncbi:DUF397 domain-containing protein [Thermopolyspora sp. NPDC052614]|uniref:DUF397 domain-containing protein n=1 Tax=Thermopolyspora sp. NPDC052614 TaxID=3155682 RepID=UPI00344334A7
MADLDLIAVRWRKSSRSGENGGNCVEVAVISKVVALRDSKNAAGPALLFSFEEWKGFLQSVRSGQTNPQL